MKPLRLRSYGTQSPKLGLTYHIDLNHIKTFLLVQLNLNGRIKSCNDFMKRGFAAQFGERLNFISPQPRRRDPPEADKFPHKDRRTSPLYFNKLRGISEFLPQPTGCGIALSL